MYIGRLPADASWRDLQDLLQAFGEILHIQLPFDRMGRKRGFGVVEFASAESATVAVRKLEFTELRGQQLVVRDDTQLVATGAKASTKLYVGNMSPAVTRQALSDFMLAADASAKVSIPTDAGGQPMGFAFVEFRTAAAADSAMRLLHNVHLDQRPLFLRPDVDASASDEIELAAKREKLASKMQQMQQVDAARGPSVEQMPCTVCSPRTARLAMMPPPGSGSARRGAPAHEPEPEPARPTTHPITLPPERRTAHTP